MNEIFIEDGLHRRGEVIVIVSLIPHVRHTYWHANVPSWNPHGHTFLQAEKRDMLKLILRECGQIVFDRSSRDVLFQDVLDADYNEHTNALDDRLVLRDACKRNVLVRESRSPVTLDCHGRLELERIWILPQDCLGIVLSRIDEACVAPAVSSFLMPLLSLSKTSSLIASK